METVTKTQKKYSPANIRGLIKAQAEKYIPMPFEADESNFEALNVICEYFSDSPEFEKRNDGWSLRKGLLIVGPAGTGKTILMKCLQQNPKRSFTVVSCRKIMDLFCQEGRKAIRDYSSPKWANSYNSRGDENYPDNYFNHRSWGYCYDDFGAEDKGTHFGDTTEVMEQVILDLYEKNLGNNFQYNFFHITSNLTTDQIEARYGTRVKSRMREMFNLIPLKGADRRR